MGLLKLIATYRKLAPIVLEILERLAPLLDGTASTPHQHDEIQAHLETAVKRLREKHGI